MSTMLALIVDLNKPLSIRTPPSISRRRFKFRSKWFRNIVPTPFLSGRVSSKKDCTKDDDRIVMIVFFYLSYFLFIEDVPRHVGPNLVFADDDQQRSQPGLSLLKMAARHVGSTRAWRLKMLRTFAGDWNFVTIIAGLSDKWSWHFNDSE